MLDVYAPRCDIEIAGTFLAADISRQIISVRYENNLDMADMFSIVVRNADNRLLDSALFDLGKTVKLYLGYGNALEPMIWGEITSLETVFPENGAPSLRIAGYDRSYRLRHNNPARTFRFMNPSLIAMRIAVEAGLIPAVDPVPTLPVPEEHQDTSDFATLKAMAEPFFMDVYVRWDRLHFQFPRPVGEAIVLEWGRNLSSFSPRISTEGQTGIQIIRGYNQELAQSIVAFALAADLDLDNITERLGTAGLDTLLAFGRQVMNDKTIESPLHAIELARSVLRTLLEGLYEGTGTCVGNPMLRAGGYVQIEGVGKRFSGTYRLRKVTHTLDDGGYRTELEITQRAHSSLLTVLRKRLAEAKPPDKPAPRPGVYVGEVAEDTEMAGVPPAFPIVGRVRVKIPQFGEDFMTDWAPCAMPMTGADMGMYFLPKRGDQVLVTFADGDVKHPYVLGSLWNATQPPPVIRSPISVHDRRMIKSKAGHTIVLDDGDVTPGVTITSSGGHTVVLDDSVGSPGVSIRDALGSEIALKSDGSVTISASTNLTIKANGIVTIEATMVDVK